MKETVYIMPTEFNDLTTQVKTLGFRIFNNTEHSYDNRWTEMPSNEIDIFKKVLECDDFKVMEFLDSIEQDVCNVVVGGKLLSKTMLDEVFQGVVPKSIE